MLYDKKKPVEHRPPKQVTATPSDRYNRVSRNPSGAPAHKNAVSGPPPTKDAIGDGGNYS